MLYQRKKIKGFEKYEIDTNGVVYSLKGLTERILIPQKDKDGYFCVKFWDNSNGKRSKRFIHRLLLQTFKPRSGSDKLVCRHLDGNNQNNELDNLEWGTAKENENDKKLHGTAKNGFGNPNVRLTITGIVFIKKALALGIKQKYIANVLNISQTSVSCIKLNKRWADIKLNYNYAKIA